MLRFLTDEHISPAVAEQAHNRYRFLHIEAMRSWRGGRFLGASDELVIEEAHQQRLTLVTFDLRTVPPLLRRWAEQGMDHSGSILFDERTLAPNDIGGLVTALCTVWKVQGRLDWTNRVLFLRSVG